MTVQQARPTTVAIVGRPNVGKSALFNRLAGRRLALVEDLPGTTRDRVMADIDWYGRPLRLVDTGGLESKSSGQYAALIRTQIEAAMREADAILFVVDGRDGLTAEDYEVAELLRRAHQPVLLVANKVDNARREQAVVQFYELGFGEPASVSAQHGTGVADMLDALLERAPRFATPEDTPRGPALAIIGRPNVGKSALLNALLDEDRVIVSDVPGTTRDAVDTTLEFQERALTLIDTAGIRRRGHIEPGVERHSVLRTQAAVERCDVALVLMDATEPATAQDAHVIQIVEEQSKGLVLVINKTDLVRERPGYHQAISRVVRQRLRFVSWAPLILISAQERSGLDHLLQTALAAAHERETRVPTAELNSLLQRAMVEHAPPSVQGRRLKLLYATQAAAAPPTFVLFVNDARLIHFSYERYLENRLREVYGFEGTAIRFILKSRAEEVAPGRTAEERIAARETRKRRASESGQPSGPVSRSARGRRGS